MLCIRSIWGAQHTHTHTQYQWNVQCVRSIHFPTILNLMEKTLTYFFLIAQIFHYWLFMMPLFTFHFEMLPSASLPGFFDVVVAVVFSGFFFLANHRISSKVVKHTYTKEIVRANTLIDQRESEICFIALNNQRIFLNLGREMKEKKKVLRFFLSNQKKV